MRWLHDRSIGQKFFISFGVILSLLALSLTALLVYLSRINSYVDRHKRITVPAIVTAATMQRSAYEMNLTLHLFLEQITKADAADTLARLSRHAEQIRSSLDLYRSTHAARTHPILLGMLTQHQRMDLADQEDRAIARIDLILQELSALWQTALTGPQRAGVAPSPVAKTDGLIVELMNNLDQLVAAHRDIDVEMKVEGDLLLQQARLIALSLVAVLGLVITVIYVSVNRQIAKPLQRLSVTADRVAHHDLTAQFESWPGRDEVGTLAASLSSMVTSLREQTAATARKTKELEAFTYSVAHDLKGPLREIEGLLLPAGKTIRRRRRRADPAPDRCDSPLRAAPHPYDRRAAQIFPAGATGPASSALQCVGNDHHPPHRPVQRTPGPEAENPGRLAVCRSLR
jgi:HAMP domain-containing protein